ncbi:LytR/AlgR family response regulator transcription factor [Marinimicrobium locisalis]|uniref:LytR/AlgR family response regulator transcription factor n=1 Tax=Marinimicrobium locisalis TaxID=546022 RepID=UPI00322212BC
MELIDTLKQQWRAPLLIGVCWRTRVRYYKLFTLLSLLTIVFMHVQLDTPLSLAEFSVHILLLLLSVVLTLAAVEASGFALYRRRDWPLNVTPRVIWLILFPLVTSISFIGAGLEMAAFELVQVIAEKHEQHGYHPHHFLNHASFVLVIILIIHGAMIHQSTCYQEQSQKPAISQEESSATASPIGASPKRLQTVDNPSNHNETLVLKHDGKHSWILMSAISHIHVDENYCHVWLYDHTEGARRITVRSTLSDITDRLPEKTFLRTHRSYVVNLQRVAQIKAQGSSHYAVTDNGFSVPISKRRVQSINNRLNENRYESDNSSTPVVKQLRTL